MTPKKNILCSLVPLVKHFFVTVEEEDNQFKITCQFCNGFMKYKGRSLEMLCIAFIHSGLSTLGLHPE